MNRRKSPASKKHQISHEKLLEAIKKKKLCNDKAQKIVERLIENGITKDEFLNKLIFINQSHYDDIVEERSIIKRCGYPLCSEPLINIPNQQYIISLNTNKVFDITERKKFCSKHCFTASQYIKEQILTSPLWIRNENDLPDLEILEQKKEDS